MKKPKMKMTRQYKSRTAPPKLGTMGKQLRAVRKLLNRGLKK